MAQHSGFFNSLGDDRVYDSADFAGYFGSLVTNGIFYNTGTELKVTAGPGMSVNIASGRAWINGYHYHNDEVYNLPLSTGNGTDSRTDRIVLRWDLSARTITLRVLEGQLSGGAFGEALTQNDAIWELALADVQVAKAATSISDVDITDRRLSTLCGEVNSLVRAVYQ